MNEKEGSKGKTQRYVRLGIYFLSEMSATTVE